MSPGVLLLLTFAAGALVVLGLASVASDLFLKDRSAVSKRLDEEFRNRQRQEIRNSPLFKNLDRAGGFGPEEPAPTLRQRVEALIQQSGVDVTPERLLGLSAGAALGLGAVAGLVRQDPIVGLLAALVGGVVPLVYVRSRRAARLAKLLAQLPDAFDLMARVIRAGQTTEQAIQAVADEFPQPLAAEFAYCAEQQNLGLAPEVAYRDLARRTGLLEIRIFVLALVVQQQTGGNLAEIMDKLGSVVRERFKIAGKIKALTAEGRMQGLVLLVLPFGIMGIMMLMSSKYAESLGRNMWLVGVMVVIEAVGAVWVRKIVNFDY